MARGAHNLVRKHRRRLGLTQHELAHLIGFMSSAQISRLERGLRYRDLKEVLKIELICGVAIVEIFARLSEISAKELTHEIKLLIRCVDFGLRRRVSDSRMRHKAEQLRKLLVSLRRQGRQRIDKSPWEVITLEEDSGR